MTSRGAGGSTGRPGPVARVLVLLVRAYRLIPKSPVPRCRFVPSCSAYALEALELHGAWRGTSLALRRVARCHPFDPGGVDPVPAAPGAARRERAGRARAGRETVGGASA